jgi:hypothetical protein
MSLQDMRDFVRSALDTDIIDLPDGLLDRYIVDGSNRVEAFSDRWTFRQVDYSFTTVAGAQSYDIRSDARVTGITQPIVTITDVRAPNWSLKPADHSRLRSQWRASTSSRATPRATPSGADSLYLWPIPSSAQSISISGYRQGIDWVSTTPTSPDMPSDFHELIAWWALNRGHAREGDPQMADFYRNEFERELPRRSSNWITGLDAQPLVLGGDATETDPQLSGLGPLTWPWE